MSRAVDVSDSWEDIDETELEKRLKEEKVKREREMSEASQNGLLLNGDDGSFRPRILQRQPKAQQSQIKILKRPESSSSLANQQKANNSKPQIKTLEQREKEYAEARKRILGSSESPPMTSTTTSGAANQKLSPTSSVNNLQNFSQQQQQRVPDHIIRQPRGPGGGPGFNVRR